MLCLYIVTVTCQLSPLLAASGVQCLQLCCYVLCDTCLPLCFSSPVCLQRPLNTRDPVSLAGREQNFRNTPISWKGPNHEKCIVDKVMVTSEYVLQGESLAQAGYGGATGAHSFVLRPEVLGRQLAGEPLVVCGVGVSAGICTGSG